jgi:hypothetical protein
MEDVEPTQSTPALLPEYRVVIVPREPGPLIDPDPVALERVPDEIDEAIDDIFGPDPGGSPGRLDVVLFAGGLGLIVWSQLSLHSTGVTVVGCVLAILGSILPIRSLWRRRNTRRVARRRGALSSKGLALNVSHPVTHDLVTAYGELLAAAALPGTPLASDAVSAAHLALTESAVLVGETGPATPGEIEYLQRRITAMRDLVQGLQRYMLDAGDREDDAKLERNARALAGEELDATGMSSVRELDDLKRVFEASSGG